jgi:hypothetical protein
MVKQDHVHNHLVSLRSRERSGGDYGFFVSRWRRPRTASLLCIRVMDVGWISGPAGGRAPFPWFYDFGLVGRRSGSGARIFFISMVTSRTLWEWCGSMGLHMDVRISGLPRSFIDVYSLFFVSGRMRSS